VRADGGAGTNTFSTLSQRRLPARPMAPKGFAIGSARALPCAAALAACAGLVLLRTIQAYLGHRNIQHTVRYTELAPDRFKDFWRS